MRAVASADGPCYIALRGGKLPLGLPEPRRTFTLGKAAQLREGSAAIIIGCGPVLTEALEAADRLEATGLTVSVPGMHTVKPLDREAALLAARHAAAGDH